MSSPTSMRFSAPEAPPPRKKVLARAIVKVVLPSAGGDGLAHIFDEERKIGMSCAPALVVKRFPRGQTVGYFKAELDEDGILEVGDAVPDPVPAW